MIQIKDVGDHYIDILDKITAFTESEIEIH
jgi:hypothetical protein